MTDTATQTPTPTAENPADERPSSERIERPGSLPTPAERAAAAKDKTLTSAAAIEMARLALGEITEPLSVGLFTASKAGDDRLVTHLFECNLTGYRGWRWAVTMTRPPRGRTATICEMELLPGEEALLAPAWVPWADRLQPGDVTRSDRLPKRETDERLEPGWEATGDDADALALDVLDLGRPRVLSPEGIQRAAQRWYDGDHGPDAEGVRKAHATCSTCGFFMPLSGPMRNVFGVCANEWAADDGTVVSLDHGCGAHSETDLPDQGPEWPVTPSRLDEAEMVQVATDGLTLREGVTLEEQQVAEAEAQAAEEAAKAAEAETTAESGTAADAAPAEQADAAQTPEEQEPAGDAETSDEGAAAESVEPAEAPAAEKVAAPAKPAAVDVPTAVTPDDASADEAPADVEPTASSEPAQSSAALEHAQPTDAAESAARPHLELDLPEMAAEAPRKRRRRAAKPDDADTAKALADLEASLPSR